jgi:hypothetical protein
MFAGLPLLAAAGCGDSSGGRPAQRSTNSLMPDTALVDEVLHDEKDILGRIDAAMRSQPAARHRLAPARSIVATHVTWLADLKTSSGQFATLPPETGSPTGTSGPSASNGPSASSTRAALRSVSTLCTRASERRLRNCLSAEAGPLAQLLASMFASYVVLADELRAL